MGFVINRKGRTYSGALSDQEVVAMLSTACGHWGSCADYLHNAITNLELRGIHDRYLWRLQELVASRDTGPWIAELRQPPPVNWFARVL